MPKKEIHTIVMTSANADYGFFQDPTPDGNFLSFEKAQHRFEERIAVENQISTAATIPKTVKKPSGRCTRTVTPRPALCVLRLSHQKLKIGLCLVCRQPFLHESGGKHYVLQYDTA